MSEAYIFILTIVVGFFGAVFGNLLNWPDAGTVFAIATVGTAVIWEIRHQKKHEDKE